MRPSGNTLPRTLGAALLTWRSAYGSALLLSLLANLLALVPALFGAHVYDRILPNRALETLVAAAIGLMLALVIEHIARACSARVLDDAGTAVDASARLQSWSAVLGARFDALTRLGPPAFVASRLRDLAYVREVAGAVAVGALINLPFAFLFAGILLIYTGVLVLVPLVAGVIAIAVTWVHVRALRRLQRTAGTAAADSATVTIEALQRTEALRSANASAAADRRFAQTAAASLAADAAIRRRHASMQQGWSTIAAAANAGLLLIGCVLAMEDLLTPGGLIAATTIGNRLVGLMVGFAGLLPKIAQARIALTDLGGILDVAQDPTTGLPRPTSLPHAATLVLRDVRVTATGTADGQALFHQPGVINFTMGQRIALVGSPGAGKTTLLRTIAGLCQPAAGVVALDGLDLSQLAIADRRQLIAYLPLHAVTGRTLREALDPDERESDARLVEILQTLGIDRLAQRDAGLHWSLGDGAGRLSAGETRMLGLARLLVQPAAPIVLLDEPTASLDDAQAFRAVQAISQWLPVTSLLIAASHDARLFSQWSEMRALRIAEGRAVSFGQPHVTPPQQTSAPGAQTSVPLQSMPPQGPAQTPARVA